MKISDIQARLGVPASTLAFHLGGLVGAGLVSQEKVGREVICRARHRQLTAVMEFLREHCCEGLRRGTGGAAPAVTHGLIKPLQFTTDGSSLRPARSALS